MSQRLTRKEIKQDIRQDEFRGFLLRIFDVVQQRPSIVVAAAGGIVAVALVLGGIFAFVDSRGNKANEELAEAMKIAEAPVVADGSDSGEPGELSYPSDEARAAEAKRAFEQIRGGVGASVAAEVADLYLANLAASEGDTETARAIWDAFLKDHDDHVLALSVQINLIHLDRQSGRAREVAEELQRALDSPEKKILPEDVILFELAQTLEVLDDEEAALEAYQRILDDHPKSPYTAKARQMTTSAS